MENQHIIQVQHIINTYDERQQNQCDLFQKYVQMKKENPLFGYKKIAKLLNQQEAKTRWWHTGKHKPTPMQTAEWLTQKELLPLTKENKDLRIIARILGATFGDGGIFENLNGIFLSSAELESVKEFGEDLKKVFGEEIEQNSRIIEGGEYGHSWCYQNTNRNIIRFFMALGAPIGDKSQLKLLVPQWITESEEYIQDEFFGSFFGGEIGIPKVHIEKRHLDTLALGITGKDELAENRIEFLNIIGTYLNKKGIKTGKISINDHKKQNRKGEPTKIYRLLISTELENVHLFNIHTQLYYCKYKKEKLESTIKEFIKIKEERTSDLMIQGYSLEEISKILRFPNTSLISLKKRYQVKSPQIPYLKNTFIFYENSPKIFAKAS